MPNRTFGCVRLVWNKTLSTRRRIKDASTSYRAADAALTETCSTCGHLLAKMELSIRHWTCPGCRTWHDRDLNAAKNILAAG